MNEMLQRAVEAIKDSSDNTPEGIARTVISALREPTDAMKIAMMKFIGIIHAMCAAV